MTNMLGGNNLRAVNLNLLPTLLELLRNRNVTRTAEVLELSQPAVSSALGRLRTLFHDDLMIAQGRKLVPTAFAERLEPALDQALQMVDALLATADGDSPSATSKNRRTANLNLLPILRELLRKRNVTRAAEALNMTQPAASDALSRLRELLQDPILIAQGRTVVPTEYAQRIEPALEEALYHLEAIVSPRVVSPREMKGTIVVATADYVVFMFGTKLAARLKTEAPNISIDFREASTQSIYELRMGQIDFIILPSGLESAPLDGFDQQLLFQDEMVCVVGAGSHLESPLSEAEFLTSRHVTFRSAGDISSSFGASMLQKAGCKHFDAVAVPSFLLLPFLAEATDSVAIVQRRLAERLSATAKIRIIDLPFSFPKLNIVMAWNRTRKHDPAHKWFRELVREIAQPDLDFAGAGSADSPSFLPEDPSGSRSANGRRTRTGPLEA